MKTGIMLRIEQVVWGNDMTEKLVQLKEKAIDGLLITQFISAAEAESVVASYRSATEKMSFEKGVLTYPVVFTRLFDNYQLCDDRYSAYKKVLPDFYAHIKKSAATPRVISALNTVFSALLNKDGRPVSAFEKREKISPVSFRELPPGSGEFQIHYEDLTFIFHAEIFEACQIPFHDMMRMSYFIMLQPPEEGGELECFDFPARIERQQIIDNDTVYDDHLGIIHINSLPSEKRATINPDQGDIFIFHASSLWHRVNRIKGSRSRITLGGFLFLSDQRQEIISFS